MYEAEYYFNDHIREALGFGNPNLAGVFVAISIPYLWAFITLKRTRSIWTILAAFTEVALWFVLASSASRGGTLAVLSGLFVGTALVFYTGIQDSKKGNILGQWRLFLGSALRAIVFILLVNLLGVSERMNIEYAIEDKSIKNRLEYWHAGLDMIKERPFSGFGHGLSGYNYVNWFQNLELDTRVYSLVNTPLTLSVELGVLKIITAVGLFLGITVTYLRIALTNLIQAEEKKLIGIPFCLAPVCSTLGFYVSTFFTHITWNESLIWLVYGSSIVWMLGCIFRNLDREAAVIEIVLKGINVIAILIMITFIVVVAHDKIAKKSYEIEVGNSYVRITRPSSNLVFERIMILPSKNCFGYAQGKAVRCLSKLSQETIAILEDDWSQNDILLKTKFDLCIAFSDRVFEVSTSENLFSSIILVLPTVVPSDVKPSSLLKLIKIIVSTKVDTSRGINQSWQTFQGTSFPILEVDHIDPNFIETWCEILVKKIKHLELNGTESV